jgi:hypothetical protein
MYISKKIRQYKKIVSNKKKQIAGAEKPTKSNEFNIQINYNGPLITPDLWRRLLNELRMGTGFNLTKTISSILNDPYLSVCRSTAIMRITANPEINLSLIENSIMISCDKNIPHYYVFKPHVIHLIQQVLLKYDSLLDIVNLFIQNGEIFEHEVIYKGAFDV